MAAGGRLLDAVGVVYQTLHGANFISVPICVYSYFPGARRLHLRCTVFASLLARGLREGGSLRKACARVARAFACARLARSSLFEACARFARAFACARLFARRSSREPCARLALREADIGQSHIVGRIINLQKYVY